MTTVRERGTSGGARRSATPGRKPAMPSVRLARWQVVAFVAIAAVYVVYTLLVLRPSDVGHLDRYIFAIHIRRELLPTPAYEFLLGYVYFGQRGVATFVFLPYFIWTALRLRSARPLIMLAVGLLLLNVSVGAVKLATGRLGPRVTGNVLDIHVGGDIYPSGHVSNVVVLYGLIAWISLRHRALFTGIAAWLAISVGAAAIIVNTHWLSDVVGGWLAGSLVLLALPWFMGPAERIVNRVYYRHVKHHTDPWVARLQSRWPRLRSIGPMPLTAVVDPDESAARRR